MLSTRDSKSPCSETCIFLRNKNQHDADHHFYARINDKCILERKKKNKNKNVKIRIYENDRQKYYFYLVKNL